MKQVFFGSTKWRLPHKVSKIVCLAFLPWTIASLQSETTSFESLADFEVSFQSSGSTVPQWKTKGGVGGSGCLAPGAEGYVACGKGDYPLKLGSGQKVTVAMDFLYGKQATRIAERNAGVFLASSPDQSPLEGTAGSSLSVYLFNVNSEPGQDAIRVCASTGQSQGLLDKGTSWSDSSWWHPDEMEGHWCRLQVSFTKLPEPGMWGVSVRALDLGEDGELEREILALDNIEISAESLYSAPEIFAGFQNLRLGRGFNAMDNFTVTSE